MLDKNQYIRIDEAKIICGQTSGGVWYCKELPASTTGEIDTLIGEINIILNKYNNTGKGVSPITPPITKKKKPITHAPIEDMPRELEESLLNEAKEKYYDSKYKS